MSYAHVTVDAIDQIGQPPQLIFDGTRWWDMRGATDADLATVGWYPVTATPRPPDTPTTTFDYSVTLVASVPTETWTARAKTQAELDAATAAANAATLRADTTADLAKLSQSIDALAVLLADDTTTGSIRAVMGPAGAASGTGSLRALKAQTNTAVVSAASIKGLIDRTLDLAQRAVDDAQATRRIARQTLRLARDMVGDYSSADVR